MSGFLKRTIYDNNIVCINSYNYIFNPIFYMLGIVKDFTTMLLDHYMINFHLNSHRFKEIVDEKGIPINTVIVYFRQIYKEAVGDRHASIKTCYYINNIIKLLLDFKENNGETMYSDNLIFIVKTIIYFTHHEILLRSQNWFKCFSTEVNEYWPNLIAIYPDSFKYIKNEKNRIVSGNMVPSNSQQHSNIEFWIYPLKNHTHHVRFSREVDSNNVHIGWGHTDSTEWFCDLICDGIFYAKGGHLCRMLFADQRRIKNKQVIIHSKTKDSTNIREFVEILKSISAGTGSFRTTNTPWGVISFDVDNLIDFDELSPYYRATIIDTRY